MSKLPVSASTLIVAAAAIWLVSPPVSAAEPQRQAGALEAVQLAQSAMIEGEVRKVDMSAGKITLRHGPIPKYDMATPMTMVFPARDPSSLSSLKVGDKVLFDVEKEGGSLTVTQITKVN